MYFQRCMNLKDFLFFLMGPFFTKKHHQFQYFEMSEAFNNQYRIYFYESMNSTFWKLCIIYLTHIIITNKSFPVINYLPQKLSNYSTFPPNFSKLIFQFFKSVKPIFVQSGPKLTIYTLFLFL